MDSFWGKKMNKKEEASILCGFLFFFLKEYHLDKLTWISPQISWSYFSSAGICLTWPQSLIPSWNPEFVYFVISLQNANQFAREIIPSPLSAQSPVPVSPSCAFCSNAELQFILGIGTLRMCVRPQVYQIHEDFPLANCYVQSEEFYKLL